MAQYKHHLDENCPSNRQNQNCDNFLIFCLSVPTTGQLNTTKYGYIYYGGCGGSGGGGGGIGGIGGVGCGGGGRGGGRVTVVV